MMTELVTIVRMVSELLMDGVYLVSSNRMVTLIVKLDAVDQFIDPMVPSFHPIWMKKKKLLLMYLLPV